MYKIDKVELLKQKSGGVAKQSGGLKPLLFVYLLASS